MIHGEVKSLSIKLPPLWPKRYYRHNVCVASITRWLHLIISLWITALPFQTHWCISGYYLKLQTRWVLQEGDDWSGTATSCVDKVSLKPSCRQQTAEQQANTARHELQSGLLWSSEHFVKIEVVLTFLLMNALFDRGSSWAVLSRKAIKVTHFWTVPVCARKAAEA